MQEDIMYIVFTGVIQDKTKINEKIRGKSTESADIKYTCSLLAS